MNIPMKNLFKFIDQAYRQNPEKFDRLTSLLVTQIDDPNVLFLKPPKKFGRGKKNRPKRTRRKVRKKVMQIGNRSMRMMATSTNQIIPIQ